MFSFTAINLKWCRRTVMVLALLGSTTGIAASNADKHFENAAGYHQNGDNKAAVIELKNALQAEPSHGEARYLLGKIYLDEKNGASAEKELRRARSLGVEKDDLEVNIAEALVMQRKFNEALSQLPEEPSGDGKARARVFSLRGVSLAGNKNLVDSRRNFEAAVAADANAVEPAMGLIHLDILEKHNDAALERLEKLLQRKPGYVPALLAKADLQRGAGHQEEAIESYTAAIAADEKQVGAYVGRATSKLALVKPDEAKPDLDKAEELKPGLVMVDYLRGLMAFQNRDLETSREYLRKVITAAPNHHPSEFLYGVVSYGLNDLQVADEFLSRYVTAYPGHLKASKLLGATRVKLKEPGRAIQVLEPLLASNENDVQLLAILGSAYMMRGDHDKGAELMEKAVDLNPDKAALRIQLAMGFLAEGKTEKAVSQLQSAVDLGQDLIHADVLLVLTHLRKKEFEQALEVSSQLEKRMPDNPVPFNLTGLAYMAKGDEEKARSRFNKALELNPEFVTAEANLAKLSLKRKDYSAAEKHFKSILAKDKSNLGALLGLAAVAEAKKDSGLMVKRLEEAGRLNPEAAQPGTMLTNYYIRTKQPLKALATANDLSSRLPRNPAALNTLGRAQAVAGEMSNAARTFERLVELRPSSTEAYVLLGGAKRQNKDYTGARDAFERAMKISPKYYPAALSLGSMEVELGNFEDAIRIAKDLQAEAPDLSGAYELEGLARHNKKQLKQAVEAYKKALEKHKSSSLVRLLAAAYQEQSLDAEAEAVYREWLKAHPEDLQIRMLLAMTLQRIGDSDKALLEYEYIYERNQANAVLMNNLAWLYYEKKDRRALEVAKKAYDINPKRAEIADTYGWIMLNQGNDPRRALNILQEVYITHPTNAEIGYHVAVAQHKMGKDAEARRTLNRVLTGNPSFSEVNNAKALMRKLGN